MRASSHDRTIPSRRRIGFALTLTSLLVVPALAQPLVDQHEALVGLESVRVEVQLIGAAEAAGLTHDAVQAAVVDRLRDSTVGVHDPSEPSPRGDPALRVAVQVIDAASGYAFLVSVQLVERVVNYRRYVGLVLDGALPTTPTASVAPLEIAPAIKWEAQGLGTTSRENASGFIPRALVGYVDRFLDDYRSVN